MELLNAIAIYYIDPTDKTFKNYKRLAFSQSDKSSYRTFKPADQLENTEKLIPAYFPVIKPYEIQHVPLNNSHEYLAKFHDENILIAISSCRPLGDKEQKNLARIIAHIYVAQASVKAKLDDIIAKPLEYTGKDLLRETQENVDSLKEQGFHLIEQVLKRGEDIDVLADKAEALLIHSENFKNKTRSGCCG